MVEHLLSKQNARVRFPSPALDSAGSPFARIVEICSLAPLPMNLNILEPKNPKLRKSCQEISPKELKSKDFQNLINEMLDIVYGKSNKGAKRDINKPMTVGLSANQIGINKRISIVDLAIGRKKFNDIHVLINPEIIWHSKTKMEKCEGCVNLPNIWGYVERSRRIKVRAIDRSGNKLELDLKDWPAILLQHEIDHLNGRLFIDRLKNPKKAHLVEDGEYKAHKKAKKEWKKFVDVSDLVKV